MGVTTLEMIQQGNLDPMRAIEKFDCCKGSKLFAYATWWMRQAVTRAIAEQSRTIRLPVHIHDVATRISYETMRLTQETGREPTIDELPYTLEISPDRVKDMREMDRDSASIYQTVVEGADTQLAEMIEDKILPLHRTQLPSNC